MRNDSELEEEEGVRCDDDDGVARVEEDDEWDRTEEGRKACVAWERTVWMEGREWSRVRLFMLTMTMTRGSTAIDDSEKPRDKVHRAEQREGESEVCLPTGYK